MASKTPLDISIEKQHGLKRYNLITGSFHAIQAIAILALSNGFALPIHINYLQGPPVPDTSFEQVKLFNFPVAIGVATFSILSAIAHFYVSGPGFNKYIDGLRNKRNYFRWVEYAISSTVMILLISMLNAVWDIVALIAIAGVNISMILFGWLQEKYEEPGTGSLMPFWFGCIAGIVPWIAMFWLLISPGKDVGPFVAGMQTKKDQTDLAVQVMSETIANFVANGPSDEEMKAAKENLTNGFPLRIDSNKKILDNVASIAWNDLPLDTLDTWTQQLNAVTKEQVMVAYKKHLDINKVVTVVVGGQ